MKNSALNLETQKILVQLKETINHLSNQEYTTQIDILSNATIGEHTRHIVELFQQLNQGYHLGLVNYDARQRDVRIQENLDFATQTIDQLIHQLDKTDKKLKICSTYNNRESEIESNYLRELMFNIEHCIHHQAIIKTGLLRINKFFGDENFGIAKSTIEYKNNVHSKLL